VVTNSYDSALMGLMAFFLSTVTVLINYPSNIRIAEEVLAVCSYSSEWGTEVLINLAGKSLGKLPH
jgi:hypothetical protein